MTPNEIFVPYVTVFRSRLGLLLFALDSIPPGRSPEVAFRRKIRQAIDRRVAVTSTDPAAATLVEYLREKRLVTKDGLGTGRYEGLVVSLSESGVWSPSSPETISVAETDLWLSDVRIPSTIGAPTPENAQEVGDFALLLGLVDRSRYGWSSLGNTIQSVRKADLGSLPNHNNPFLFGLEAMFLLRLLVARDGLALAELAKAGDELGDFRRDHLTQRPPILLLTAVKRASLLGYAPATIERSTQRIPASAAAASDGPGVLEHRTSP